jgi:hypothetical protein
MRPDQLRRNGLLTKKGRLVHFFIGNEYSNLGELFGLKVNHQLTSDFFCQIFDQSHTDTPTGVFCDLVCCR